VKRLQLQVTEDVIDFWLHMQPAGYALSHCTPTTWSPCAIGMACVRWLSSLQLISLYLNCEMLGVSCVTFGSVG
jgi:hypothetical protein